ncbi:hypothetical protein BB561_000638 [Smittium simulii]|uniref:J domain-containing protein n=1 Tax=Smittium simulii TaxID=133385 RepID=A0A2T9YY96_9FUNG|nr:hypothetical protein BB561_000638 [Smittium simulii]
MDTETYTLTSPPSTFSGSKIHAKPSFAENATVNTSGKYVHFFKKVISSKAIPAKVKHHYDFHEIKQASSKASTKNAEADSDDEEEDPALQNIKARDWKKQDHYTILGLSRLRYNATPEDISKQYRKKALKHHPDKKMALAGGVSNPQFDEYYKCVQKAHNTLIDPVRRRQFDSVDPSIPDGIAAQVSKKNFYKTFGKIFELEARFSRKQPAPKFGDANSSKEETEEFYGFFFNFDSWRSFEYLDKEDAGGAENRDNKRYIEKKNKSAREKAKKEDNQRMKDLINECFKQDPRIARYKEEDKTKRNAKKNQKEAEEKAALEAKLLAEEQALKEKLEAEEAERLSKENNKKDKEQAKKIIKKEKKTLKSLIKDSNYFCPADETLSPTQIGDKLEAFDKLLAANKAPEQLVKLRSTLEASVAAGNAAEVFASLVAEI